MGFPYLQRNASFWHAGCHDRAAVQWQREWKPLSTAPAAAGLPAAAWPISAAARAVPAARRGSTRRHTWIRPRRIGRHPLTGEPLSDKSKVVAGLLQLLGLLGLVGIGRIYLGYTGLGIAQLVVGLITCGIGAVVWGIIDAVLILTDKVRDPEGRPLRDGT